MTDKSTQQTVSPLLDHAITHSNGVRLGTLVLIRWMAIAGQLLALLGVHIILGFDVRPELTIPTIMVSSVLNLWFSLRDDLNSQLTETQSAAHLTFDLLHLTTLLFLTGGLANPFSILMLAPASVSASILRQSTTKLLIVASIGLITLLAITPFPLPWDGPPPETNTIIMAGIWISLCFTLLFLALYMARLAKEGRDRARALAATRAALEQEQRLSELGTLAAAAAHELGTPLGTILLVSKELLSTSNDPITREDLELIVEQTTRCRDILAEIGEKRRAGNAEHFNYSPLEAILREAASPHENRGPTIKYESHGTGPLVIKRTAELLHAFRNIIENAAGYARNFVQIRSDWDETVCTITIQDDGPGFDPQVIKRLGDPYVTTRQPTPGMDGGMGLGLFIAKTLLERSGATVTFGNMSSYGAGVIITWPRSKMQEDPITISPSKQEQTNG